MPSEWLILNIKGNTLQESKQKQTFVIEILVINIDSPLSVQQEKKNS